MGDQPITLGSCASAGLKLTDAAISAEHAELIPQGDELKVRSLMGDDPVLVNGVPSGETFLRHGDVLQVGTTRLFVQHLGGMTSWDTLSRIRRLRAGLTIMIPLLVVLALSLQFRKCRHTRDEETAPPPLQVPPSLLMSPTTPDDCLVTNIPRISIHESVTLTAVPPEVTEAIASLPPASTNEADMTEARHELDAATQFLMAAGELARDRSDVTNQESGVRDLEKATALLGVVAPPTNTLPTASGGINPAPSSQTNNSPTP